MLNVNIISDVKIRCVSESLAQNLWVFSQVLTEVLASVSILEIQLHGHIYSELPWFIKEEKEKCGSLQIDIVNHKTLYQ